MNSKFNPKVLMFTSIAIISFLFAFSPTALTATASTGVAKSTSVVALSSDSKTIGKTIIYNAVDCAVKPFCVATTDIEYADVVITQGTTLVATVAVCGAGLGVVYVASMKAWAYSDYDCGEVESISAIPPYTVKAITAEGAVEDAAGIVYDARNKMLYAAQFGFGEVAAVNSKGAVTEINLLSNCSDGYYPQTLAVALNTGMVYVPAPSSCVAEISGTRVIATTEVLSEPGPIAVNQYNSETKSSSVVYVGNGTEAYVCRADLSSCSVITGSENLAPETYNTYDKSVWATNGGDIVPISKDNVVGSPVYIGVSQAGTLCSGGKIVAAPQYYYNDSVFLYNVKAMKGTTATVGEYYPVACGFS